MTLALSSTRSSMYRRSVSGIEGWTNDPVEADRGGSTSNPSRSRPTPERSRRTNASGRHMSSTASLPCLQQSARRSSSQSQSNHNATWTTNGGTVGRSTESTRRGGHRLSSDSKSLIDLSMSRSRRNMEHSPDPNETQRLPRSARHRGEPSSGVAAPSLGDFLSQNRADDSDEPTGSGEDTDDDDATFFSMFQWSKSGDASPALPAAKKSYSSSRSVGGRSMGGAQPHALIRPARRRLVSGSASVADVPMYRASPFGAANTVNNRGLSGLYSKNMNDDDDDDDDDEGNGGASVTSKPIFRRSVTGLGATRGWMSSPEDDADLEDEVMRQQSIRRRTSQRQLSKNDFLEKDASEKFDRFLREREGKLAAERQSALQVSSTLRPVSSASRNRQHRSSTDDISRSDGRDRDRRHRDRIADEDRNDDRDREEKKKKKKKDRSSRKSSDGIERKERKERDDGGERRHRGEGEERSERKHRVDEGERERRRPSRRVSEASCEGKLRSASRRPSIPSVRSKETSSTADCEEAIHSSSRRRKSLSCRSKGNSSEADGEEKLRSASRSRSNYIYRSKGNSSEADGEEQLRSASRRRSSHSYSSKGTSSEACSEDKLRSASRRRSSRSHVSKEESEEAGERRRKSSSRKVPSRRRSEEIGDEIPRRSGRSDISEEDRARISRRSSRADTESSYGTPSECEELSRY